MTNSVDPDQTAPIGAVCSGSTLFASIINLSVLFVCLILFFTSHQQSFSYIGTGLPGLNQY